MMTHKRAINVKLSGAVAVGVLICLVLIVVWGLGSADSADSWFCIGDSFGQEILECSQGEDELFLVLRDGESIEAHALNLENGQMKTEPLNAELTKASVIGDSLGIYYRDEDESGIAFTSNLTFWKSSVEMSDAKKEQYQYFIAAAKDKPYGFTADGTLFLVSDEGELQQWGPFDPECQDVGLVDVEFMTVTPGEWIYVYALEALHRWKGSSLDSLESWPCDSPPVEMIGEDAFVDITGAISFIQDGTIQPAPEVFNQQDVSLCLKNGSEIYAAEPEGNIFRYDLSGEKTGHFEVEGKVLRLVTSGALVEAGGKLWFAPYQFHEIIDGPEETPTPEPSEEPPFESSSPTEEATPTPTSIPTPEPDETASPSPTPGEDTQATPTPTATPSATPSAPTPSPTPSASPLYKTISWYGVDYMMMNEQMTIQELRIKMEPQAVKFYDAEGNPISGGMIKTGMKMDEQVIVILGDCNGSGYVTSKDLEAVGTCILGSSYFQTDAEFLAADLDGDGSLTLRDMVLLSELIDTYNED